MAELTYPFLSASRLRMSTDGEGVTTLVAGAGCPLSCKYCINRNVLQKAPTAITAQELFQKVKIDDLYFQATGGGITFGGGEALLHAPFIREFRALIKNRWRIHAETSLYVPREHVDIAAQCVDSFIVDIKDMDPLIYLSYTEKEATLAHENLLHLKDLVGPERILVRLPLIPKYNTEANQAHSAEVLRSLGFTRLDLFRYIIRSDNAELIIENYRKRELP
ncbi:MAG: radical SAM protein [Oscillospiraceae bacterium]|nr:radical SAM protein [Oscillospiraceae bacterium]